MSELPFRLSDGAHKVVFQARQDDAVGELKAALDRKYVHVKFAETRGGTELGFRLDEARCDLTGADWEKRDGPVHLEGELKLDGVPVRVVADLDLATLQGTGRLELLGGAPA